MPEKPHLPAQLRVFYRVLQAGDVAPTIADIGVDPPTYLPPLPVWWLRSTPQ